MQLDRVLSQPVTICVCVGAWGCVDESEWVGMHVHGNIMPGC